MSTPMSEEQIVRAAEFYGISMEEAQRRYAILQAHTGDPGDPICVGCARRPDDISTFVELAENEGITPTEYAIENEGTLNRENGHFLCDSCYIRNGMPASDRGWRCP